jgi:hypothetical protein
LFMDNVFRVRLADRPLRHQDKFTENSDNL